MRFRKGQFVTTTTTVVNKINNTVMPSNTVYAIVYSGKKTPGKLRVIAENMYSTCDVPADSCTLADAVKPNVKVGDVFVCTWGYGQTNVDFYMVIKLTTKMAWLAKLAAQTTRRDTSMSGYTMPVLVHPNTLGNGRQYRIQSTITSMSSNKPFFRITNYSIAYPWDGKEQFFSEWA